MPLRRALQPVRKTTAAREVLDLSCRRPPPLNQRVGGSSPPRPTNKTGTSETHAGVPVGLCRRNVDSEAASKSPHAIHSPPTLVPATVGQSMSSRSSWKQRGSVRAAECSRRAVGPKLGPSSQNRGLTPSGRSRGVVPRPLPRTSTRQSISTTVLPTPSRQRSACLRRC
jgi:hypothetical protein